MRIHLTIFILLVLFSTSTYAQQNGTIKGKITSSDGQPAAYVSLGLKNKNIGTTTNNNGEFTLSKIKPGTYTLKVSAVGINSQEKEVNVSAGQTVTIAFVLVENSQLLTEVNIKATKNKYKVGATSSSLRLEEPLLEAPQNIQIVSNQVLADQQIISMSDGLVRNVSGAIKTEHWGDMYANIKMRGSQIQAFRNGFNIVNSYWGPLTEDMSFVDHIEFVKGPAGFMLASGDPSGLYNVVTKKPTGVTKGEASLTMGSFDLYRAALDLDGKLSTDGKLQYRLNLAGQKKGSHRPFEFNNRYSVAPVITYQFDDQTKLTAEYIYQGAKMSDVGSFYVFSTNGYATLPRDFTLLSPGLPATKIDDHSLSLNLEHKINDSWKLTAQAAYYNYYMDGTSIWPSEVNPNGTIIRGVGIWQAKSEMALGQVFLNGNVRTGAISHRILAGLDGGKKDYFADYNQSYNIDSATDPFNVNNPNYGTPSNGYPVYDTSLGLEARAVAGYGVINQRYTALYLQDELGFFNNALRLTLAGRYTYIEQSAYGGTNETAKHFTPRVGLSYSINNQTSVYGLYDQAFIPQSGNIIGGGVPKPITGNNIEFGVKRDWAEGKWNTTLSVYRILKNNELGADPNSPPTAPISIVIGQKRAQGVEFDLKGQVSPGFNVIANYAYTDGRVTKGVVGIVAGDRIPGYAKHTTNAWLSYAVQNGFLKGTGISGGFTYLIDRATDSYSADELKLPNYFKLDGGLFWEKDKIKITGNVFNILDKYLYSGSYYAYSKAYYWQTDPPRSLRLSVNYKF